jgi:GNAT superfamily N-acetyltransferase
MAPALDFFLRHARADDIAQLEALIAESARGLSLGHYTPAQIEAALGTAWGVDSELVRDETCFVVETAAGIVGCGGWSRRKTLFGGDRQAGRQSDLLDPARDSARIRAFFVRPSHARHGIGRMLLERCEADAMAHGFRSAELLSTLPGCLLYAAHGYAGSDRVAYPLAGGGVIDFVPMRRAFTLRESPPSPRATS